MSPSLLKAKGQKACERLGFVLSGGEFGGVEGNLKLCSCEEQTLLCRVCIATCRIQIPNDPASSHENNARKVHGKSFLCPVDVNPILTRLYPTTAMVCLIWLSAAARSSSGLTPLELHGTMTVYMTMTLCICSAYVYVGGQQLLIFFFHPLFHPWKEDSLHGFPISEVRHK